jgi:response regulator RpfG family c-di-GMP phosphodiesterase
MKHAVEEIARCSGTHFDPCMVEAFMRCCPLIEEAGGWEKN